MTLDFGAFMLRGDTRQVLRDGREVHLSPKAFDLLQLLVVERPRALSKAFLQERLWPETFVCEANLPSLVSEIRQVIGDDRRQGRFIRTVHGYGYAFCATAVEDSPSQGRGTSLATYWLSWDKVPIALRSGDTILGREPGVEVWLDVPSLSRRHARIAIRDDLYGFNLSQLTKHIADIVLGCLKGEIPNVNLFCHLSPLLAEASISHSFDSVSA